jgi:hypothetical protein
MLGSGPRSRVGSPTANGNLGSPTGASERRFAAWVFSLLPLVAASRFLEARRKGRYDPRRELDLPQPIYRALEAVLSAERLAIAGGVNLPVGLSRLVVAEKR